MTGDREDQEFRSFIGRHYGAFPAELEPTGVPGYFRYRTPCGGAAGGCRQPLHSFLFQEGPCQHTIRYVKSSRDSKGRFVSPYRYWKRKRDDESDR